MYMLTLDDIDVTNRRVLLREDLNVPLNGAGEITDATRIDAAVPSIRLLLEAGAAVLVVSHLGRPEEGVCEPELSLAPVARALSERLGRDVPLVKDWIDGVELTPGECKLAENCRFLVGEKKNDDDLARRMAALCEVFVNDAFGAVHRAQASTHGVAKYAPFAVAGPLLAAEVEALSRAVESPLNPVVGIVGGSKVSTKLDVLTSLADKVDTLVVGGGIANTFLLAAGHPIGKSLAEPDMVDTARAILARTDVHIPLPTDVVTATEFSPAATGTVKPVSAVGADELILDVGPDTTASLAAIMRDAGTIIWNGPLGVFEFPNFAAGTRALTEAIAASDAFSLAGGGDTIAAINAFGAAAGISYISTGGGAFLEFLEGRTLPAIAVLEERARSMPGVVHPSEPHA